MNNRTYISFFILPMLLLSLVVHSTMNAEYEAGEMLFYEIINTSTSILFVVVYLMLIPMFLTNDFYHFYHNRFDHQIVLRMGYAKYIKNILLLVFRRGAILNLIGYSSIILFINYFVVPFNLSYELAFRSFLNNHMLDLICFILFASIGAGILSCLSLIIIPYFKNKYVYMLSLVLLLIASLFLYAGMHQILIVFLPDTMELRTILNSLVPSNLFHPGSFFMVSHLGMLSFGTTSFIYLVIVMILFKVNKRRMELYG